MYLIVSKIKSKAHESGKRVGSDFLLRFNAFIDRKLDEALRVHIYERQLLLYQSTCSSCLCDAFKQAVEPGAPYQADLVPECPCGAEVCTHQATDEEV